LSFSKKGKKPCVANKSRVREHGSEHHEKEEEKERNAITYSSSQRREGGRTSPGGRNLSLITTITTGDGAEANHVSRESTFCPRGREERVFTPIVIVTEKKRGGNHQRSTITRRDHFRQDLEEERRRLDRPEGKERGKNWPRGAAARRCDVMTEGKKREKSGSPCEAIGGESNTPLSIWRKRKRGGTPTLLLSGAKRKKKGGQRGPRWRRKDAAFSSDSFSIRQRGRELRSITSRKGKKKKAKVEPSLRRSEKGEA